MVPRGFVSRAVVLALGAMAIGCGGNGEPSGRDTDEVGSSSRKPPNASTAPLQPAQQQAAIGAARDFWAAMGAQDGAAVCRLLDAELLATLDKTAGEGERTASQLCASDPDELFDPDQEISTLREQADRGPSVFSRGKPSTQERRKLLDKVRATAVAVRAPDGRPRAAVSFGNFDRIGGLTVTNSGGEWKVVSFQAELGEASGKAATPPDGVLLSCLQENLRDDLDDTDRGLKGDGLVALRLTFDEDAGGADVDIEIYDSEPSAEIAARESEWSDVTKRPDRGYRFGSVIYYDPDGGPLRGPVTSAIESCADSSRLGGSRDDRLPEP